MNLHPLSKVQYQREERNLKMMKTYCFEIVVLISIERRTIDMGYWVINITARAV